MTNATDERPDIVRTPPEAFDAERDVLGGLLVDGELAGEVFSIVSPDDFYRTYNRQIAECMLAVHRSGSPVDITTTCEEIRRRGWLEEVGGGEYIAALHGHGMTRNHTLKYAVIIQKRAVAREIIRIGREAVEAGYEAPDEPVETVNRIVERFLSIAERGMGAKKGLRSWTDSGEAFEEIYQKAVSGTRPLSSARLGIVGLDEQLGPLSDERVIVLLGRRGQGKTQLAVNAAMSTAYEIKQRNEFGQVLIFSFESEGMYKERGLSWATGVDNKDILNGFPGDSESYRAQRQSLEEWWPELPAWDISDCEDVSDEDGVEAQWRIHAKKKPIKLVVVDYWQAMKRRTGRREIEEYDALALRFKELSNEYKCPVLILSQETYDRQSKTASAKNSKTIEEVATMVLRLGDEDILTCEKKRRGMAFRATKLHLDKAISRAWTAEEWDRMKSYEEMREV